MNFKGKDCVSHVPQPFSWNGQMREQFLQIKSLVHFLILHPRPHRAWLVAGIFHTGEVIMSCGGQCNGADFTNFFQFPEIEGELSMHKHTRAWEQGYNTTGLINNVAFY